MKNIPLYKPYIPFSLKYTVSSPIKTGWLGYGNYAKSIENTFTEKFGGFAISTNSCTSALYIAGRLIFSNPDDEVVVPAITFVSTAMAFKTAGLKVVIADIDNSGMLDVDNIQKYVTKNTKAIIIVDLYGQKAEIKKLKEFCNNHNIVLIEDCAHRIGFYDIKKEADICCFSFNVMKELPSGEGGLLWCRDKEFESSARKIANVGLAEDTVKRTSSLMHRNYLFSDINGLKLLQNDLTAYYTVKLFKTRYKKNLSIRKKIFEKYDNAFINIKNINIFPRTLQDSYLMYVVRVPSNIRDGFRKYLSDNKISTSMHYPNLAEHPIFSSVDNCENAKIFADEVITLPCFPGLSTSKQNYIINKIKDYFSNAN